MASLIDIERYLRRTGLSASKFGRLAVNDSAFVGQLRGGRQMRDKMARRVAKFIADQK